MGTAFEGLVDHPRAGRPGSHFDKNTDAVFIGLSNGTCKVESIEGLLHYGCRRFFTGQLIRMSPGTAVKAHVSGWVCRIQMKLAVRFLDGSERITMNCHDTVQGNGVTPQHFDNLPDRFLLAANDRFPG